MLHAGTLVVQGDGAAIVEATGIRTTLGRIGGVLASIEPRPSRLHEQLVRLVRAVAFLAVLTCVFAASVFAWRDGSWTAGLLVGLTLAMSIIPEEFAVVWTVMLALGAWRLARENVLTRQPQAVEALGATTVLCVDKTGTLTCNRMTVVAVFDGVDEGERRRWPVRRAAAHRRPGEHARGHRADGPGDLSRAVGPEPSGALAGAGAYRRAPGQAVRDPDVAARLASPTC